MATKGFTVGPYRVLERLGSGGMGEAWRAERLDAPGRQLVLKTILPHLAGEPGVLQRFLQEARLAAMVHSPNLVALEDAGEAEGGAYLVLELVDGISLEELLVQHGPLAPALAAYVARELCAGLAALHEHRTPDGQRMEIVHRDVSPSNVLLSRAGEVKLTDLGIAHARSDGSAPSTVGRPRGKLAYMAPEQAFSLSVDARADIFSAGVVLYRMLSGRIPYEADSERALLEQVGSGRSIPLEETVPEVPEALGRVVRLAMARSPGERYPSARLMGAALGQVLDAGDDHLASQLAQLIRRLAPARSPEVGETSRSGPGTASHHPGRSGTQPGSGGRGPDSPPEVARTGTSLGEWELGALLGVGGMACVYEARNALGQEVAIKVLHHLVASNPELAQRFGREAKILEQLSDQPAVLRYYGTGKTPEGDPYLVVERLRGRDLASAWRARGGRMEIEEAVHICIRVLELLEICHAQGIVHRDLKPANVFLCESGAIKVLDFGVARARHLGAEAPAASEGAVPADALRTGPELTQAGAALGTAAYMAPEQAVGRSDLADDRADVFAVGAMLYQLLSGTKLRHGQRFEEVFLQATTAQAPSLARAAPDLPPALIHLVDRAVAWDPRERFPSARKMREALQDFLAHGSRERSRVPEGLGGTAPAPLRDPFADEEQDAVAADEGLLAVRDAMRAVELALATARNYGWSHPEGQKRLGRCQEAMERALRYSPEGLGWEVKPSAFTQGREVVWAPDPPFNSVPYDLFGAGIHYLRILPGIGRAELEQFLKFLMLDPVKDLAPDDDLGVRLWEMDFEQIQFQLVSGFHFVEHKNASSAGEPGSEDPEDAIDEETQELLGMLVASGDSALTEAQSLQLGLIVERQTPQGDRTVAAPVPDREALAALVARAEMDVARSAEILVHALADGVRGQDLSGLAPCLEDLVPSYTFNGHTIELIRLLGEVLDRLTGTETRSYFLRTTLPTDRVAAVLDGVASLARDGAVDEQDRLMAILHEVGAAAVEPMLALAPRTSGELYEDVLEFLFKHAHGFEAQLGAAISNAPRELGGALLRVLRASPSPFAASAVRRAAENPDLELRLSALKVLVDLWPQEVAADARPFLSHPDPAIRIRLLKLLAGSTDRKLVSVLLDRFQDAEFEKLPNLEQRLILGTLHRLDPRRAESALVELLHESLSVVRLSERVHTQRLAIHLLARWGTRPKALKVLDELAQSRWGAPPELRKLADASSKALRERMGRGSQ